MLSLYVLTGRECSVESVCWQGESVVLSLCVDRERV